MCVARVLYMSSRVARLFRLKSEPCYGSSLLLFFLVVPSEQRIHGQPIGRYSLYTSVVEKTGQCNGISNRHTAAEENCGLCRCKTGRRPSFAFATYPTYLAIIKSMLRRFAGHVVCRCKAQHVSTAPQLVYGGKMETR